MSSTDRETESEPASRPLKLIILISGGGSNMLAIVSACRQHLINAEVALVISDSTQVAMTPGMTSAAVLGVEVARIPWRGAAGRAQFEEHLSWEVEHAKADLIVLAGFMRVLSPAFAERYAGRILNIHPSLLPKHKGLHTHRRVLEAGDAEHGASVHFVTPELDSGPVVLQSRITVRPEDTEETLSRRVLITEHQIYPQVIGWVGTGQLQWRAGGAWLDGQPLTQPVIREFA